MKIALVTDAWTPQVNGVVRTLTATTERLREAGHRVETMTPDQFRTVPCPSYPEIRLALGCRRGLRRRLAGFSPEAVHIATEGPLGWAARRWCLDSGMPFTTSFHTRFPEYVAMRTGLPAEWFWPVVRRFHRPAGSVFAATDSLAGELGRRGLPRTHRWSRGVDLGQFSPNAPALADIEDLPRPILLNVGRVAVEKNIAAFLSLETPGSKVVVGDGPARAALEQAYPAARFLGALHGNALASAYATADVLVFPSLTDTFGLVIVEALASGLPVAAYPVQGPLDVLGHDGRGSGDRTETPVGALDQDLGRAVERALLLDRRACREAARRHQWQQCTDQFLAGLQTRAAA